MQNWISFLRWQFQGCLQSLSFWGFLIVVLGVVLSLVGLRETVIPNIILGIGAITILVDAARAWFALSYSMYQSEKREVERRLTGDK